MKKNVLIGGVAVVLLLGAVVLYKNTRSLPVVRTSISSIYQDVAYGFELTATPLCKGDFVVHEEDKVITAGATAVFGLYVKNSAQWNENTVWQSYEVMPAAVFHAIDPRELPGRPRVVAVLKNGDMLTSYSQQDGPGDVGTCVIAGQSIQ